ncbi:MAG TPA: hypothetical protein VLD65_03675 [Anaerolineales bacterium]|nr:hypothetical protein [Anaerolineales bacterium]
MNSISTSDKTLSLGVGFRYSSYGQAYNPGRDYWARVGMEMVKRFPGAAPEVIWIVSEVKGVGTHLSFPGESQEQGISFAKVDDNEQALNLFDRLGFRVWLQVEPVDARVETLIDLILNQYEKHSCVVGIGVDVEWHHSFTKPEGEAVSDEETTQWLTAIHAHDKQYRLFLKHWEAGKLPHSKIDSLLFVDDSQMFASLEHMLAEFAEWGRHFYPAPVAYQFGYPADKKWWSRYEDPPKVIGEAILKVVPNTAGLYWVNFSALEVFPP